MPVPESYPSKVTKADFAAVATEVNTKLSSAVASGTYALLGHAHSGGSGLPSNILTKTSAFTAAAGDFILADATSGGFTITLPSAPATGALVTVKKVDTGSNVVAVAPAGGGTIDGDATATISSPQFGAIFEHTGSNVWQIVAPTSAGGYNGVDGKTVRSGAGVPSGALGVDGDFYINTSAFTIYGPKTAGSWGSATSLIGPQGTIGGVQDEGVDVATRTKLNFVGSGVTAVDDSANNRTNITISSSSGGALATKVHNPAVEVTKSNAYSTTITAVDSTNLVVTFTAPASGAVALTLSALSVMVASQVAYWLVTSGGTEVAGSRMYMTYSDTVPRRYHAQTIISGLTPGNSYTWTWATAAGATGGVIYYGDAGGSNRFGAAIMKIDAA